MKKRIYKGYKFDLIGTDAEATAVIDKDLELNDFIIMHNLAMNNEEYKAMGWAAYPLLLNL